MKNYILFIILFVSSFQLNSQCIDNGNYWNQSWVSCTTSENPNPLRGNSYWVMYEFQDSQSIDSTYVWNANRTGESGWGAKDVIIDYSPDGIEWVELGQFEFPQAPETDDYAGFEGPEFNGVFLEKILITILSTYDGGSCVSIAEMQFKIDQTACYGIVDACGVCDGPGEFTYYLDADGDGLGDPSNAMNACEQPIGYVEDDSDVCDNGNLGWSDAERIFESNGCYNCHGGGANGGLDLRSYATTALGGDICGTNLLTGTTLVDIITISGYDGCGIAIPFPSMNDRVSEPIDAQDLALLQEWINGGAPDSCVNFCPNFQTEIPYNGIDDDCDLSTLDDDLDQDGFVFADDCDDENPEINPNATEIPDNDIDEDCDGFDMSTSTLEIANSIVKIYPNPTKDIIYIDVEGTLNFQSTLYSLDGKVLVNVSNPSALEIKSLPGGTYLLEIDDYNSKQKVITKIIKVE